MWSFQLNALSRFALLVSVIALAGGCVGLPKTYRSDAVQGVVLDATTGRPVEGALVLLHVEQMGGLHRDVIGYVVAMESVTDATGTYKFPAWNRPVFRGAANATNPIMRVVKQGYELRVIHANPNSFGDYVGSRIDVPQTKQPISLKPAPDDPVYLARQLSDRHFGFLVEVPLGDDPCVWERTPRFATLLVKSAKLLQDLKQFTGLPTASLLESDGKCRSFDVN